MKAIDNDEELLDMALELMALSEQTQNPLVKKLLHNFARGINEIEEDCQQHPFLLPIPLPKPRAEFKGNGVDVNDLHCRIIDDRYVSIWHCSNFWFRWQFLIHGVIALELWGPPFPIGLRLDTEALGFQLEG